MAMSRSLGWTLLTTRAPIEIVPEVMFSSPASIRSKVDLPHPEGPTKTTKAPSSIGIDTPCKTSKPPNDFRTSRICTDDILDPPEPVTRGGRRGRPLVKPGSYQTFSVMSSDQSRIEIPCAAYIAIRAAACKHRPPIRTLRTKTRRVRCGRNHEQAAHRDHKTQAPLQRMVK